MMKNGASELSRGLRFILGGVGANLLVAFLPGGASLAAAGICYALTALGLFFATRADKRFWVPLLLLTVNTFAVDLMYSRLTDGTMAMLVSMADLLLSVLVICMTCLFTLPFVKGKVDGGEKQGQWAWKCQIASAVCALSVALMKDVPGMESFKVSLSMLSSLCMLLTTAFYLYFLWKASGALGAQK